MKARVQAKRAFLEGVAFRWTLSRNIAPRLQITRRPAADLPKLEVGVKGILLNLMVGCESEVVGWVSRSCEQI